MQKLKLLMMEMKTFMITAVSLLMLVSCSKIEQGIPFEEGQEVTFGIGVGSGTKVTSSLDGTSIKFLWEEGDKVSVKVGNSYATFDMCSISNDRTEAYFKGKMPADGSEFTVQYPAGPAPDITQQTYSADESLLSQKIVLSGTGTLTAPDQASISPLKSIYAILKLNLYGANITVDSIKVTIGTTLYTLDCKVNGEGEQKTGVQIGTAAGSATAFRLVVPAAENQNISVDVTSNYGGKLEDYDSYGKGTPITKHIFTATGKTFTVSKVLNMNPVELSTVIWAPVNCGYNPDSDSDKFGKYYQFGRKYGQSYNPSSKYVEAGPTTTPKDNYFYSSDTESIKDWYTTDSSKQLAEWPSNKDQYIADPCPNGWRIPTSNELMALLCPDSNDTNLKIYKRSGKHGTSSVWGCYYNGTPNPGTQGVFLPLASYIKSDGSEQTTTTTYRRSWSQYYWSSNVNGTNAQCLSVVFDSSKSSESKKVYTDYYNGRSPKVSAQARSLGGSVRCVQK